AQGAVPCQGGVQLRLVQRLTLVGLALGPGGRGRGRGDRGGRADQGQAKGQHGQGLVGSTHGILLVRGPCIEGPTPPPGVPPGLTRASPGLAGRAWPPARRASGRAASCRPWTGSTRPSWG